MQVGVGRKFKGKPACLDHLRRLDVWISSETQEESWCRRLQLEGQRGRAFHPARAGQERENPISAVESCESEKGSRVDSGPSCDLAPYGGGPSLHLLGNFREVGTRGLFLLHRLPSSVPHVCEGALDLSFHVGSQRQERQAGGATVVTVEVHTMLEPGNTEIADSLRTIHDSFLFQVC